jgi:hypothetical protein
MDVEIHRGLDGGSSMSRFAHLNLFVAGRGYHEALWRIPSFAVRSIYA